jgi:hypothetical protein
LAKFAPTTILDKLLDAVALGARMTALSAQPSVFADIAGFQLGHVATVAGDFAKAADGSGRKLTVAQKAGATIDANGTATHIAIDDGVNLLYVTTCTSQALTVGNPLTFNSWAIHMPQPT